MTNQIQNRSHFFGLTFRRTVRLVIILIVIFLALGIITLTYVDSKNKDNQIPIINIADNNGKWEGQEEIKVFDEDINPGSNGAYTFIIQNDNQVKLSYSFKISQFFNDQLVEEFPIFYRLKMNNQYLGSSTWLECNQLDFSDFVFLPESKQEFVLEWSWPFDGNDDLDTSFGKQGGKYYIKIDVSAQVYEE